MSAPSKSKVKTIAVRELSWLFGCTSATTLLFFIALHKGGSEYGYAPVPFFSLVFYTLTGLIRYFLHFYVRWLSRN
jgi:hypothetical protein